MSALEQHADTRRRTVEEVSKVIVDYIGVVPAQETFEPVSAV
jgi:hypothetical protein